MLEFIETTEPPAPEQLLNLHRFVTRAVARADMDVNLTVRQIAILTTLRLQACTAGVKGIAEYLHIGKPIVTRALDRLIELDLATRQKNPHDRRTVEVALTARGEQLVAAIGTD